VLAALLAVGLQCYGLYRPEGPPQPEWLPNADKIGHLLGFALPLVLVLLVVARYAGGVSRAALLGVVGCFVAQAVASELVQGAFYPDRSGDVADLVADLVGIGVGLVIFWLLPAGRRRPGRTGAPP
jgi:VanZ family protein